MTQSNEILAAALEKECLSIRNVGHDINNALAGLLGYSELLLEDEQEDEARDFLAIIREKSKTMMLLMKELSSYVRDLQSQKENLGASQFKSTLMQYIIQLSDQLKRLLDDIDMSVIAFKKMDHLDERTRRLQERFSELVIKLYAQCEQLRDDDLKRS